MSKKICKLCGGQRNVHLDTCEAVRSFDADCTCGNPLCSECKGTGLRGRHTEPQEKVTPPKEWDST